jgi:hypothetical protein
MRSRVVLGPLVTTLLALTTAACGVVSVGDSGQPAGSSAPDGAEVVDESVVAGANQNDRSRAVEGEDLQTGAMVVSPNGRFIVLQRNTQTVLYDARSASYSEVDTVLRRVAFANGGGTLFAVTRENTLRAIDLETRAVRWTLAVPGGVAPTLLRVSEGDAKLLVANAAGVHVIDAARGALIGTAAEGASARYATFVPGQARALVVAPTVWKGGGPHTPVVSVDLEGANAKAVDVPNCEAPIEVLPNARRAFLSPTYCSPGAQAVPGQVWTNPDPVSVIELEGGVAFNKNLPGFGPVAMSEDGVRVVAYLDVKRMDATMFDDPKQVPWSDGPRYHLMTIDPNTLRFQLAPIGNAIPRFAMTRDGRTLLVDASAKATSRTKLAARATVSVGADGIQASAEVNLDVFGSGAAFGAFDLGAQRFTSFTGPRTPLDRFVQLAGGRYVLALERRADEGGGTPYMIDLAAHTTTLLAGDYSRGVRDVGLSADGSVALVRIRLPAVVQNGGYYGREALCVTADGTCSGTFTATYEASAPFALVPPPPPEEPKRDPLTSCPDRTEC